MPKGSVLRMMVFELVSVQLLAALPRKAVLENIRGTATNRERSAGPNREVRSALGHQTSQRARDGKCQTP